MLNLVLIIGSSICGVVLLILVAYGLVAYVQRLKRRGRRPRTFSIGSIADMMDKKRSTSYQLLSAPTRASRMYILSPQSLNAARSIAGVDEEVDEDERDDGEHRTLT